MTNIDCFIKIILRFFKSELVKKHLKKKSFIEIRVLPKGKKDSLSDFFIFQKLSIHS